MSNKNLYTSSTSKSTNRKRSDSKPESTFSTNTTDKETLPSLKRRFSATRMLAKAKDTTKSLVHEVLEKRHSLDSKRSSNSTDEERPTNATITPSKVDNQSSQDDDNRTSSLNSLEKLRMPASVLASTNNLIDESERKLSSKRKHYSLPIRRPFTIKKDKSNEIDSSLSSFSSSSSTAPAEPEPMSQSLTPLNAAAAAEADILSGCGRPGSFATACDFRLANEKRNEEFHALFKSVQENDMLIQDYKCALQKDILLQGHLYVSEHHVCFKSNIFGWVTNLVISFDEITEIEKKMTAKIIPNGITISTATSKHVFASFLSRDQAYDQIDKIWDLCRRAKSVLPSATYEEDIHSFYDRETDDEGSIPSVDSAIHLNSPPLLITAEEEDHDKLLVESVNMMPIKSSSTTTTNNSTAKAAQISGNFTSKSYTQFINRPRAASDSQRERRVIVEPKSDSGSKRELLRQDLDAVTPIKKTRVCPCTVKGEQYMHIALNETYSGTVEAMFKLLFDSTFIKTFLERYENFEDVQVGGWKHGTREVVGKRRIKSSTMGIRLVKTLFQEKRIHKKYPYYSCVTAKKSMPDMPMGAVYSIQSRTCITRVSKDKVHVLVTFQVAFSKSGLVSSIIEKNAADDQMRQYSHLHSILNKPDLMRELVDNPKILEDLHITSNGSSVNRGRNLASKGWISQVVNTFLSIRLVNLIYFGFFLVLVTHCLLALRLKRITQHLEAVQQQKHVQHQELHPKDTRDTQWINQRMDHVQQRLNQLKGEAHDFDKRILKMQSVQ